MSFFDEDDDVRSPRTTRTAPRPPRPRRPAPAGPGGTDQQTLLIRRGIALGAGVLFLILLVVAVRGCLDSRKKDSLKDYNQRVGAILQESTQTGRQFFDQLRAASGESTGDLTSQVSQFRVAAESQLSQAKRLDVPDEMAGAQRSLLIALEFREDGLASIAKNIGGVKASEEDTQTRAVELVAGQMQAFLASDVVVFQRVGPLVQRALASEEIGGQARCCGEDRRFLPNIDWLSANTVAGRLGSDVQPDEGGDSSGGDREPAPGLHGTGLVSTTVGGTALQPGGNNRIPAGSDTTFEVKFANQGENDEADVRVVITISGSGKPIRLQKTVDSVPQGTEATASIALNQAPPIGEPVTIKVDVRPVPGEKKTDNNVSEYPAIFSR